MRDSNEFEEISLEICSRIGGSCFPVDPELEVYIANTLSRLPRKDLDYILDEVQPTIAQITFNTVIKLITVPIVVSEPQAVPIAKRIEKVYIAFVSDLCKQSKSKITYTIAHEFAHAFCIFRRIRTAIPETSGH